MKNRDIEGHLTSPKDFIEGLWNAAEGRDEAYSSPNAALMRPPSDIPISL